MPTNPSVLLAALLLLPACHSAAPEPETCIQVVHLKHADPTRLIETLRPLAAEAAATTGEPALRMTAHQESGSILLAGSREQIDRALDLIARIDVPGK